MRKNLTLKRGLIMTFEKHLNTFKTSLLKTGGAISEKEYWIQMAATDVDADADNAYQAILNTPCRTMT
jgi:hypothetical protein